MNYYVYKIQCKINNKVYIGQTTDYRGRWQNHKRELLNNTHTNPFLQNDCNTFGLSNFIFKVVETVTTRQQSLQQETYWINYYGGIESDNVYNVKGNGKNSDNKSYAKRKIQFATFDNFKGHNHTETSKQQISESLKQAYKDGRHKNTLVGKSGEQNSFYGKHHTQEVRQLLSNLKKGKRKYTSEQIDIWINDYNNGLSYKELSNKYNCSINSLKYIIHNKNLYLQYGLARKPSKKSVTTNRDECNGVG